jgi:hypothetical protein
VESGLDWRHQLAEQLKPLGTLFRRQFEVHYAGDPADDRWPGELLRSYALALTRQVLPYVQSETLEIHGGADSKEWRLRWPHTTINPESLRPEMETRPRDISALHATLSADKDGLLVRIPRY